jgi:hypothetical protein
VGQGGRDDRLAEADAAARVSGVAQEEVVVERTFSWLGQNRRMSKDYERLCASAEAFVYAAMVRLMARRLARVWDFPDSFWKIYSTKFAVSSSPS